MDTLELQKTPDRDGIMVHSAVTREAAPTGRRYRLPGDAVFKGTADLPEDQRNTLRWLHHHLDQTDTPITEVAPLLKKEKGEPYSTDSLYQALTGRRNADSTKICIAIERYREYVEREQKTIKTGFIETSLYPRILAAYQRALRRHRIVFIFGESQIGKTANLEEIARRNNHGQTVMIRLATGGSLASTIAQFAEAIGISPRYKMTELRARIIDSFDPSMMLIVDECHQCLLETCSERSVHSLEFCREIIDRKKCGALFSGTNVFHDAIRAGRSAPVLRQLWRRQLSPVFLPNHSSDIDLTTFAKAYGLPCAAPRKMLTVTYTDPNSGEETQIQKVPYALQTEIDRADGLGRWIAILQEAADLASDQERPVTWGRVLLAHHSFETSQHEKNPRTLK